MTHYMDKVSIVKIRVIQKLIGVDRQYDFIGYLIQGCLSGITKQVIL